MLNIDLLKNKTTIMKYASLLTHIVAAMIVSAIILLIYASVQQCFRSSANDPQIQIARDLCNAISAGKPISNIIAHDTIDLSQSLAVFTEIFDSNGNPIQSTGFLNGNLLKPPAGVIEYTNKNMEDAVTWQPQSDVRMAMVFEKINASGKGFVAVGRSLKEIEIREGNLLRMVEIVWFACMMILLVHLLIQKYYSKKQKNIN